MINLMICENHDLFSLCVPQIIRILLAFSDCPTYSEMVLLPKFPLLEQIAIRLSLYYVKYVWNVEISN